MEFSSRIYTSPSFNRNSSSENIADRVVLELLTENGFNDDDVFSFNDDDNQADIGERDDDEVNTNPHTEMMNQTAEEAPDEDEHEFEFPVVCGNSNLCQISVDNSVSDNQISPRYPLFDRSLLTDGDFNLCNGVDTSKTDSKPRLSLMKLFDEDRETTSSSSSEAEADELDGITPGTYCVWKPKTDPDPYPDLNPDSRGKHKKSNSISISNTSNRWKVRDLLKRSYSDDNYSTGKDSPVFLFIPPISPEKVKQIGKTAVGGRLASTKTEKKIPAYKSKIGNVRLPPYLPYREDQLAAYANFTGANKNIYRY